MLLRGVRMWRVAANGASVRAAAAHRAVPTALRAALRSLARATTRRRELSLQAHACTAMALATRLRVWRTRARVHGRAAVAAVVAREAWLAVRLAALKRGDDV